MTEHRDNQRTHARARARRWYGLALTDDDLEEVCALIRTARRARYVTEADFGRQAWEICWGRRWLYAVYDPSTGMVATFLPSFAHLQKRRPAATRSEQAARDFRVLSETNPD